MRALITGANGFVGKHLTELLIGKGYEVWGSTRGNYSKTYNDDNKFVTTVSLDLAEEREILNLINLIKPDHIYHLAGKSNVKDSWDNKLTTFEVNVNFTINLLEAVRKSAVANQVRVLTIGSSEEYGRVAEADMPIKENTPLNPISPYGISKVTVSMLAKHYYEACGMQVIHARPFNHIGPGQSLGFVTSDFAKQIVDIEKGLIKPVIRVGNLESERDFTDVRDIVKAYELLASLGDIGEIYNVCSGMPTRIKEILNKYINLSSCKTIEVKEDPNRMRPSDLPLYIGNPTEIRKKTDWINAISLDESLSDILKYWRTKVDSCEEF
jgi:GDP-4-dehydro-6-deoxy-D-mannose reductase